MTVVWSTLTFLTGILLAISLVALILSHFSAWRHFSRTEPMSIPAPPPSVSLLKPVEGGSGETYEAFASFCRVEYPGKVELLVGTLDRDDPIVSVVERLRNEFPDRTIRLVLADLQGANRKTSIMEALWIGSLEGSTR